MLRMAFCVVCAMAWAGSAMAAERQSGMVVRVETGGARTADVDWNMGGDLGSSHVYGAAVGWRVSPIFRAELAYAHRPDFHYSGRDGTYNVSGNAANDTYMANLYADLFTFGRLTPFVGIGGGRSVTTLDSADYVSGAVSGSRNGTTSTTWAWQGIAGAGFAVTDWLSVDASYRYVHAGRVRLENTGQVAGVSGTFSHDQAGTLSISEFIVGLRAEF